MNDETGGAGERLDSWKAIAEYLQRDVATAARWEKGLGLPVHRVARNGRSVFAYTSEIDAWLRTGRPVIEPAAAVPDAPPASAPAPIWRWVALTAAIVVNASVLACPGPILAENLYVELTEAGVIARAAGGVEQWRHQFPGTHNKTFAPMAPVVIGGDNPGVYVATSYRARQNARLLV